MLTVDMHGLKFEKKDSFKYDSVHHRKLNFGYEDTHKQFQATHCLSSLQPSFFGFLQLLLVQMSSKPPLAVAAQQIAAPAPSSFGGEKYRGKFIFPDGSYDGDYIIGPEGQKLRHGMGTQIDTTGTYRGQWVNDSRSGHGSFLSTSGCRYEGTFVSDTYHGSGTFSWPDSSCYSGGWVRGVMHGQGTYTDTIGALWSGKFSNGLVRAEGRPPIALRQAQPAC